MTNLRHVTWFNPLMKEEKFHTTYDKILHKELLKMKIRMDYVTNSSSSNFMCITKLRNYEQLMNYIRMEYGQYGLSLLKDNVIRGKEIIKNTEDNDKYLEYLTDCKDKEKEIYDDDYFITAIDFYWTTGEWEPGEDVWILERIPDEFKVETFHSEPF